MERDFARKQIARMSQMYRFPKTELEALGELIDALLTAPTEDIARAVVSEFMETATSDTPCPMASEIKAKVLARLDDFRRDPDCQRCDDSGHISFLGKDGNRYADKCNCWARRPEPVYRKRPGDGPMPEEFSTTLRDAAKALTGGK